MMTAIDTLSIYERLKEATLNESAAKEIAEVILNAGIICDFVFSQ